MVNFLLPIVKKLEGRKIKTPLENGRRMLSVITIMCCISRMVTRNTRFDYLLEEHSSASLFLSILRLWPDQEHKRCIDWKYLDKNIPTEFKKQSYASVQMFINDFSHAELLAKPEWLHAIPVMHFLKGVSKPFQEFEFDPKKVPFRDTLIGLGAVKGKIYNMDKFW